MQPVDVAVAMELLQPLPFSTPTTPSRLRIVNRSRNYWLVTYLRTASAGRRRLFWGFIDWSDPTPTLEELSTPAALEEAQAIVGFI